MLPRASVKIEGQLEPSLNEELLVVEEEPMKVSLCTHGIKQRIVSNEDPLTGSIDDDDEESLLNVSARPAPTLKSQVAKPPNMIDHQDFLQKEDKFVEKIPSMPETSKFAAGLSPLCLQVIEIDSMCCD